MEAVTIESVARALDRAIQEGCKVRPISGCPDHFEVRSGSNKHRWYHVTVSSCTCQAGRNGTLCKHVALVAYVTQRIEELVPTSYDRAGCLETYREVMVA